MNYFNISIISKAQYYSRPQRQLMFDTIGIPKRWDYRQTIDTPLFSSNTRCT